MDDVYKAKLKFLGIHNTEKQKCNVQVGSLCPKLSKVWYIITSLKEVMSGVSRSTSRRQIFKDLNNQLVHEYLIQYVTLKSTNNL